MIIKEKLDKECEGIIYDILVIQIMCLYLKLFRYTKESKAVKNIQQIVNKT